MDGRARASWEEATSSSSSKQAVVMIVFSSLCDYRSFHPVHVSSLLPYSSSSYTNLCPLPSSATTPPDTDNHARPTSSPLFHFHSRHSQQRPHYIPDLSAASLRTWKLPATALKGLRCQPSTQSSALLALCCWH
jgi:hypothetical protein